MILKPQDQNRNTELVEIDSVKIRRAKNGVHIDYVDMDGMNQHATVTAETGWTRAFFMDRGQTFEVVKHDPELAK